jgi:hypothetical protein
MSSPLDSESVKKLVTIYMVRTSISLRHCQEFPVILCPTQLNSPGKKSDLL